MSRLTGTDAYGLMEAYNNVYASRELTEDQIFEEFETWVNSLVEEGHDLSEFTWEEMYESYIVEAPYGARERTPVDIGALFQAGLRRYGPGAMSPKPKIASLPNDLKRTELSATAAGQRVAGRVGGGNAGASVQSPTRGPAVTSTPPARSTAAPARPTAARPSISPAKTAPAPSPSLAAASSALSGTGALAPKPKPQSDVGAMIARSQARQAAQTPKPAATAPARPMGGGRERMLRQSFDPFDVVMEHLLDEGYADTEEAALKIMANMSEEWREEILEEGKSDRPLGLMHSFARGMKQKKGEKREEKYKQDSEGNMTGKYSDMQKSKRS